ncbi:hypothetical protein SY83_09415 [Paenibacillus swuensis]|uniref:CBS domain-containing protein n=1 Tax=Paenibacillus swuensis TaxID=1178515 RepID=A0A172TPY2_9BACL|nr:hypothetical protein SY83_09415 [Paenibacillus swuensis]
MNRAERFEIAFNHIHLLLKSLLMDRNDSAPFVSLVHELSRKHALIAREAGKLKQYAKLRNALVHEFFGKANYIAVPHEDVVVDIERIQRLLNVPPTALSISSKRVLYMKHNDQLITVMRQMEKFQCTSVPIYQRKQFIGLLTEDGINRWLVKRFESASTIEFSGVTAYEVLKYELRTNVIFMARGTNVYDIEDIFEQKMLAKQKVDAIIISDSGSDQQFPLGIITSWDLIKID